MPPESFHSWAQAERARVERLKGEARLAGLMALAKRHGEEGDADEEIEILKDVIDAGSLSGRMDYELRAFGELRRIYASSEKYADLRKDILWFFKWIAHGMADYADVSLDVIEAVMEEMEAFYREEAESLRPVWKIRCSNAMEMGHPDEGREWHARWKAEEVSEADDCRACEIAMDAEMLLEEKKDEEAILACAEVFEGKAYCRATPDLMCRLIGPAIRTGRDGLARWLRDHSQRDARRRESMLGVLAHHVMHAAWTGDDVRARRLAILGMRRADATTNTRHRAEFYRLASYWAAGLAMGEAAARARGQRVATTMPGKLLGSPEKHVGIAAAAEIFLERAWDAARKLDARNRTDRYAERVERTYEAIRKMAEHSAEELEGEEEAE